jgi:endonuclease YncB( thermonuclease family)
MSRPIFVIVVLLLAISTVSIADDGTWTSKPVRVDPTKQNYERLPGLTMGLEGADSISFPLRIEMHDSASFAANGIEYRLKELKAVAADRLCRSETGARWPCGAQASIFVSNLFRGKTLICKVEPTPSYVVLSGCRTTLIRIPQEIVAQGFAFLSGGQSDLEVALTSAKLRRAGVWRDAACADAVHSC